MVLSGYLNNIVEKKDSELAMDLLTTTKIVILFSSHPLDKSSTGYKIRPTQCNSQKRNVEVKLNDRKIIFATLFFVM